ncbi:DUF2975 domain-containing protein [Romboutsia weinsteinii]|uniref:DUF2975 domain-containing protein n=1 Tax=Romboutsia weinsteinii TaxID=2020949 RepID=A0A371IX99_9FIRM|nr:DUF2975 domain-containing protein [Romboutsia weinsteinii]RDY25103.1 DUF2975 domain-containing protein [Romboutsia weinsteinii]
MKKDISSKILNGIVLVGIVLTLLLLAIIPLGLTATFKSGFGVVGSDMPMIISIGIYICAVPYVYALVQLKKLCALVATKEPFSRNIPVYLKRISICAFSEILIFNTIVFISCYYFDMYMYALTVMSVVIISFVSLAIGFLSMVLGKLFDMAIEIKEENDKTI